MFVVRNRKKALEAACKRLEYPHFTARSLRRMFIIKARHRGVPVQHIAKWQGHRDVKMVLKVYDEATDEESMKLAALMKDPEPTVNPKAEKTSSVPRAAAAKSKAPPRPWSALLEGQKNHQSLRGAIRGHDHPPGFACRTARGSFEPPIVNPRQSFQDRHKEFLLGLVRLEPDWGLMPFPHLRELPSLKWKILILEKLRRTNPKKFELQSTELAKHFGE